jgi:hypothetical protein
MEFVLLVIGTKVNSYLEVDAHYSKKAKYAIYMICFVDLTGLSYAHQSKII